MNKGLIQTLFIAGLLLFCFHSYSQTSNCEKEFDVNIYKGSLNGFLPNASKDSVLKIFPCLNKNTSDTFRDNREGFEVANTEGVTFDFKHQYIQVDTHYTSKISVDVLNKHIRYAVSILGKPFLRDLPADIEEQIVFYFYPTDYGCMRLNYDFNTGNLIGIAFHSKPVEEALKDIKREKFEENLEK
jgi:hypothetical protein